MAVSFDAVVLTPVGVVVVADGLSVDNPVVFNPAGVLPPIVGRGASVVDESLDFAGGGFSFDLFESFDLFFGTLNRSEACEPSSEVLSLTAMVNIEARSDEL